MVRASMLLRVAGFSAAVSLLRRERAAWPEEKRLHFFYKHETNAGVVRGAGCQQARIKD
jgi:hypothetical protein